MSTGAVSLSFVLMLFATGFAAAQSPPVGPRFPVNQFVVGDQSSRTSCVYYERRGHDVAADPLGNFVVVWQSRDEDGYNSRILARRYNRFGVPEGDEFPVSPAATGEQLTPAVAADAAGDFVVVWNGYAYPGSSYSDVHARRFAANGSPKGPAFRVSDNGFTVTEEGYTYTLYHYSYIRNPDVGADPAGNFVVVWQRAGSDPAYGGDDDETQVAAHRFNSAGVSQGRFLVSDGGNQSFYFNGMPDVAHDAGGNFVVVWKANDDVESGEAIVGRRFNGAGSPVSGEFKVNTITTYNFSEATPVVASDASGGFLVVWGSSSMQGDDSHDMDVAARKFDATGTPLAPEFRVNTDTAGYQCGPSLAHLADDGFVVTWFRPFTYPAGDARGQQLDNDGDPIGGEFVLDATGYVASPIVAAQQGSDFVVVWTDAYDGPDGNDLFAQRFGTTEAPACSAVPMTGCHQPTRTGSGVLKFRLRSNPSSSRLTWTWTKGDATDHAEFGDPLTDASIAFCLYDTSAAPQPVASLVAFPGGFCGLAPCWNQLGSPTGPILFESTGNNSSGITQIRLTPGAQGKARISLTGRGENLSLPAGSLTAPVTMQAQASNGECWTARYASLIRKNAPGDFTAKPSVP